METPIHSKPTVGMLDTCIICESLGIIKLLLRAESVNR